MEEFKMDELSHHGILGMKWGVRRFQNADGSLTAAGVRRMEKARAKDEIAKIKANAKADAARIAAQGKADAKIARAQAKVQAKIDAKEAKNKAKIEQIKAKEANKESIKKGTNKLKSVKDMTDDELQSEVNRNKLIKDVNNGRSFVSKVYNKVLEPAVLDGSRKAVTNFAQAWLQKKLGVDMKKDIGPVLKEVNKEVKDAIGIKANKSNKDDDDDNSSNVSGKKIISDIVDKSKSNSKNKQKEDEDKAYHDSIFEGTNKKSSFEYTEEQKKKHDEIFETSIDEYEERYKKKK